MTAALIDGKAIAADLRARVAVAVQRLGAERGIIPGLAMVQLGENAASEVYVAAKKKVMVEAGLRSFDHRLPESASQAELLALIAQLNDDWAVHGILVQLPLPPQIDPHQVIAAIDPNKDVDGFHPLNAGRIAIGLPALAPCTPLACIAPKLIGNLYALSMAEKFAEARPAQEQAAILYRAVRDAGAAGFKSGMRAMGRDCGGPRPPLAALDDAATKMLLAELTASGTMKSEPHGWI